MPARLEVKAISPPLGLQAGLVSMALELVSRLKAPPPASAVKISTLPSSERAKVNYPTAQHLRDVAKEVPLDRLLVETDCPYLAPQPVRGKRNEPAYVAHTAALLAQVKGVSVAELEQHTTRNAKTFFRLS